VKLTVLGFDGMAMAAEAWRLSRDVDSPIQWHDIATIDGPVNEFPSAVVNLSEVTLLEREIFASNRTHVMWARTSFVDSPDKYAVPRDLMPYVDPMTHAAMRRQMELGKAVGLHQDEWRVHLPLSAATAFSMRISYRDVVKFAKYFEYLSKHVNNKLHSRLVMIAEKLKDLADLFTGSRELTSKAMSMMAMPKFLCEGPIDDASPIIDAGATVVANFTVPFWIRAHFIRHRPITVADNLFAILQRDDVLDLPISHPLIMEVAASKDMWNSLLGKRSCWLTQSTLSAAKDPWQEIVDEFADRFDADFRQFLPCANDVCSHHRDARNRIEGSDPGVPCPRYHHLNKLDISDFQDRIELALKSRSPFWRDEYDLAISTSQFTHPHTGE
jgi:hypothetical protein